MTPNFFEPIDSPVLAHDAHTAPPSLPLTEADELRAIALNDLYSFAKLVNPTYHYGEIHEQVFKFLSDSTTPNQLLLLPRSHMKSHCIAVWCAWWITKHPETSILYVSATTTLAEAQLYAIKNIFLSDIYQRYWPEMINPEEGKREKWSTGAISVDHPKRRAEMTRDYTIFASGLTTNTAGLHCEILVSDDVVVPGNAYTEDGRAKTAAAMSQFASVLNAGGRIKACGTRYHPADQYATWLDQKMPIFDDNQEITDEVPIWDVMEKVVEIDGVFLWPRSARPGDGKMFGFDRNELSRISTLYTDRVQFYAQYYNNPNSPESARMDDTRFQYYDHQYLSQQYGSWFYNDNKLNLYAGIDFAYTMKKTSDFTAIAVIGVDCEHNVYILELDRFKTDKIQEYYDRIERLHQKWGFRKLRAEVTAAQSIIVKDLKTRFRENGVTIKIDAHKPNRNLGNKEERIAAVLEPRYDNLQMWHYKGGYIPMLEEELIMARPPHDDLKDVLAFTTETAKAPRERPERPQGQQQVDRNMFHSRFGGVAFR